MSDIQSIKIISTEVVDTPKSHVVYVIQISTPIRTWTVKRRYSDFLSLDSELKSSVGKSPPGNLPSKHWSLIKGVGDEKLIRERRIVLEQYLVLILTSKDPSFRQSYGFKDFLSVPSNNPNPSSSSTSHNRTSSSNDIQRELIFTSQSWLIEFESIKNQLRLARSSLLKRDTLAKMGDSSGSRSSSIESKKILKEISFRIDQLENALENNLSKILGQGEKKRRQELIDQLKIEKQTLTKMSEIGIRTNFSANAESTSSSITNSGFSKLSSSENGSLFSSNSNNGSLNSIPGGYSQHQQPNVGRVFGAKSPIPPQETSETRPLEDRGLLQLQSIKMNDQDEQLKGLSKLLQKQKKMGQEINQEINEQNELLDEIESGVDKTGRKLGKAKRELNKLG
ncbi:uncharacterized protein L201_000628 [Kwoniella dendrophila CBS 6074]|uniref:Uncharacterized protein n=1 Tax=Kwoniella dendrophila CBS 6074 TaxID=1295534 RepID=A0AAX4JK19_9TREE